MGHTMSVLTPTEAPCMGGSLPCCTRIISQYWAMLCSMEATARVLSMIMMVTPESSSASMRMRMPFSVLWAISSTLSTRAFTALVTISTQTGQQGSPLMICPSCQSALAMYLPSTSPTPLAIMGKGAVASTSRSQTMISGQTAGR